MYVYILESINFPKRFYVGITKDLKERLASHNAGKCKHSSKSGRWNYKTILWFENDKRAVEFEKYLKSGAGRSFANRHFS